jgi:signal transduction histidine kinase
MNSYEYESGKKELKKLNTEWSSLIDGVVTSLTNLAQTRFISLEIQLPDQIPIMFIDRQEIHKALFIFLENAIMYSNHGDEVIVRTTIENNYLKTCIIDNGPGIPSQMKDSIFKRYEMSVEIERKIGAGISLYLAKQIVKAHGGKVSFSSTSGVGSTFCLLLPMNRIGA